MSDLSNAYVFQMTPSTDGYEVTQLNVVGFVGRDLPQPLGTAAPGDSPVAAPMNHVHPMPTGDQLGAIPKSLGQAKGDIAVFNGTNWVRLGAGPSGTYLSPDPTAASGLRWAAGSSSGPGGSTFGPTFGETF